jgi:hypothetical protein
MPGVVHLLPAFSGLLLKMKIIFNMPFGQKYYKSSYASVGKGLTREIPVPFIQPIYPVQEERWTRKMKMK